MDQLTRPAPARFVSSRPGRRCEPPSVILEALIIALRPWRPERCADRSRRLPTQLARDTGRANGAGGGWGRRWVPRWVARGRRGCGTGVALEPVGVLGAGAYAGEVVVCEYH